MDEMTQQNAALVEEAAAASESLSKQAESLDEMINFFTVDKSVAVTSNIRQLTVVKRQPEIEIHTESFAKTSSDDGEWAEF
ncbi:MAG: hypothetical protein VB957_17365 [Pseudomonadales bacterium]|jgi:hypothetical protein